MNIMNNTKKKLQNIIKNDVKITEKDVMLTDVLLSCKCVC